jgi:membrane protein
LISGAAFGRYLASFAFAYVSMYAGLASAMIALVFLYVCASIFIYGGELNSVIAKTRDETRQQRDTRVGRRTKPRTHK